MKIVVNVRFLTQPITGVQRFALEICLQLKVHYPTIKFVAPKNILHTELADKLEVLRVGILGGHAWEQFELPVYLKANGSPLLLNLANTAPLLYSNQIVTVHDLAFKLNPAWFSKSFSTFYNFLIPKIVSKSKLVITVSESSKKDIQEAFQVSDSKVKVVYNAVSGNFQAPMSPNEAQRYAPYILAVASQDPRKNLDRLIHAFNLVRNPDLKLLLIGGQNKNFAASNLQSDLCHNNRIIQMGYISDAQLAGLYQGAEAFVYPSLYEGFGLPNIEAMHFGCPVITSDIAACREVCGNAALYVNPYQTEDIAACIERLLADKQLRSEMVNRGQAQSANYSWHDSAQHLSFMLSTITK